MDKERFFNLFNNSIKKICDKYPNHIFYCYNKSIERQKKYNRLFNRKDIIKYSFDFDDIIFQQNIHTNSVYISNKLWEKISDDPTETIGTFDKIDNWFVGTKYSFGGVLLRSLN